MRIRYAHYNRVGDKPVMKRLHNGNATTLEKALAKEIPVRRDEWLKNNKRSLEACNKVAKEKGLFSDSLRPF